jgi:hypothetical protein
MKNDKLPNFLSFARARSSQNNVLDLCSSDFGRRLGQVGSEIRTETVSRMIRLQNLPDYTVNPNSDNYVGGEGIWVTYGNDEDDTLKRQRLLLEIGPDDVGYSYNSRLNGIFINPEFEFQTVPGGFLRIEYIPVLPVDLQRGRIRPWIGSPISR